MENNFQKVPEDNLSSDASFTRESKKKRVVLISAIILILAARLQTDQGAT